MNEKPRTQTIASGDNEYIVTDLKPEDFDEYYNGFANRVLWPIFHYRLDLAEFSRRDLSGYLRVNDHFADELVKVLEPDDIVWVHDYHLIPLAKALRKRGLNNRIGFFLHIPLPPPEILTAMPNHETLIPSLGRLRPGGLPDRWRCRQFRALSGQGTGHAVAYLAPAGQRRARHAHRHLPGGDRDRAISPGWRGKSVRTKLVQQVLHSHSRRPDDRGRPAGLFQGHHGRLEAYERFLAAYPEWHGKITYLQITPKSRSAIKEYAEMEAEVNSAAGRINGTYSDASWAPVRYVNRAYSRTALAGLYRAARVGLVTPMRDGMNLVAKEYVAAQDAGRSRRADPVAFRRRGG